jgi:arylsulfatase A-like enzyme
MEASFPPLRNASKAGFPQPPRFVLFKTISRILWAALIGGPASAQAADPVAGTIRSTATGSGFWDAIGWNTDSGTVTGDLNDKAAAHIGRYRTLTYRGIPAVEALASLNLGESVAKPGQGTLIIESGALTVTGDLQAGRNASANDSFLFLKGGSLHVKGNAHFGRCALNADGSLIVAGGSASIAGDLAMGAYELGGSMLRFHNPGSSQPVQVGGNLILGRCSLDLTFDSDYTHVPGEVITLVTYGSRDGQFLNFRRGQEFHRGPNRFRIDYDVGGNSITLTALPNWVSEKPAPNVVLIFTDDQGYADIQINGHPTWAAKYPMPRLQTLADAGARFTHAYVTGGVCHPSRVGLITGRYQQLLGCENNLGSGTRHGMAPAQQTVPDRLQALGIRTYGIGKWHLGETVEYHPNLRGFDRWYGMWGGSRSYYNVTAENTVFQDQMTPRFQDENTGYLTDRIGDKAVDFINGHLATAPGQPFFMYVSFTAVHGPNDLKMPPDPHADPRVLRLQNEFNLTRADYLETPAGYGDKARTQLERHRLAAMTLALDENIGKIMDRIADAGLTENTIFVYLNDNGGPGWSSSSTGGNWSYNYPLRGLKGGSMTEGSIRVPAVMTWPGTIPAGQVIHTPVISLDFMATFVNAGGAPAQARNGLDGLDLLPLLRDGIPLPPGRALTWRAGNVNSAGSAIRVGDWKLLFDDNTATARLYNIAENPAEKTDLADSQPAMVAALRRRFEAWESGTLAPFYGGAEGSLPVLDPGLELNATAGAYRLKQESGTLAWLSQPLRTPLSLHEDFHFRFLAHPGETTLSSSARLAHALGDSEARAGWIRAIIDYGGGQIHLEDGKSGQTASAAMSPLADALSEATLDYKADGRILRFLHGGSAVSLELSAGHGRVTHSAVGAAAMEGELTPLVPTDGRAPTAGRSDPSVLIENLGGGRYRSTAASEPAKATEFFQSGIGNP